jgi:hypothetical protein
MPAKRPKHQNKTSLAEQKAQSAAHPHQNTKLTLFQAHFEKSADGPSN